MAISDVYMTYFERHYRGDGKKVIVIGSMLLSIITTLFLMGYVMKFVGEYDIHHEKYDTEVQQFFLDAAMTNPMCAISMNNATHLYIHGVCPFSTNTTVWSTRSLDQKENADACLAKTVYEYDSTTRVVTRTPLASCGGCISSVHGVEYVVKNNDKNKHSRDGDSFFRHSIRNNAERFMQLTNNNHVLIRSCAADMTVIMWEDDPMPIVNWFSKIALVTIGFGCFMLFIGMFHTFEWGNYTIVFKTNSVLFDRMLMMHIATPLVMFAYTCLIRAYVNSHQRFT